MAVNINSNFTGAIPAGKRSASNNANARRRVHNESEGDAAPVAHLNIIPAPEVIRGLVDRAVSALSKGKYWDRGSILNLLV